MKDAGDVTVLFRLIKGSTWRAEKVCKKVAAVHSAVSWRRSRRDFGPGSPRDRNSVNCPAGTWVIRFLSWRCSSLPAGLQSPLRGLRETRGLLCGHQNQGALGERGVE